MNPNINVEMMDVVAVGLSVVMASIGVISNRHGWRIALLKIVVYSSFLIILRHWVLP